VADSLSQIADSKWATHSESPIFFTPLPFAIRHLPFAICHSPFAIHHLPFAICYSLFAILNVCAKMIRMALDFSKLTHNVDELGDTVAKRITDINERLPVARATLTSVTNEAEQLIKRA